MRDPNPARDTIADHPFVTPLDNDARRRCRPDNAQRVQPESAALMRIRLTGVRI
ncbi:MAG: hypothetical protein LH480_15135 [Rubrivivax sp.]|nr:hypothetical protein [Rubrivivax sp.]